MSNRREELAARMAIATNARKDGSKPTGQTAIRTKPVRVTLDLDPATYTELNRWLGTAAVEANPDFPRLTIARALRAMIHATINDPAAASAVMEQLRQSKLDHDHADMS